MTCKIPTKSEIQKFFADEAKERFGTTVADLTAPHFLGKFSAMDSLDTIDMFVAFERAFGIRVSDKDIEAMNNFSLQQVTNYIYSRYVAGGKTPMFTPTTTQAAQYSGLRIQKDGQPYCQLLGAKCNKPTRVNYTSQPYCQFIDCKIYKNFQKLR